LADAAAGVLQPRADGDWVDLVPHPVLLADWRAIDAAEIALGATHGRARTTLHERESLLAAVRAAVAAVEG
jgi:ferredoxin--NADP+ reductase